MPTAMRSATLSLEPIPKSRKSAIASKHLPGEHIPDDRPGRRAIPACKVLDALLWILNTDAQWHVLAQYYPNHKTVH